MSSEQWRRVADFPDYEVSDHGRVRSLKTYAGRAPGCLMTLSPGSDSAYLYVQLRASGLKRRRRVAGLVAEAFLGRRPDGLQVRHLNGDPQDNRAANLAWGTALENAADCIRHGREWHARKTHCPQGHEYTPENTRRRGPEGRWRSCRTCDHASNANRYRKAA